ncbi:HAD-IIIA family hydrolase [Streptomyces pseudovenezuelae]|uniref:HAD-IIIA family hydrolase n=1 Tax=Streptomyces pseudovenezuelae TaxID=67350 RepID=UPI002E805B97|nr:HAD-IIIA family hydrolase [Streptomyces pseudovenezuelae]WUA87635.1 HAD-IIIA family hydrolase [Streptomyces pseudovenezuelae]
MTRVRTVLFDRDSILAGDPPEPGRLRAAPGAGEALALLRLHGVRTGFVALQPDIGHGRLGDADVRAVNHRVEELLGPFDIWGVCPHGPDEGCHCRPPEPGLLLWAAGRVCTAPADCAVVGTAAEAEAAARVGAHGILVPDERTLPEETARAGHVAPDVLTAVRALLTGPPRGRVLVDERPIESAFETGEA